MDIGLFDMDSHRFPNLALMKISAYHKTKGDNVEWLNHLKHYDKVYVSKVFSDEYSHNDNTCINADEIDYGGTGFCIDIQNGKEVYHKEKNKQLPYEIEHSYPDYSLYPNLTKDTAYGFLTRGCCNNCPFCIVSKKEGRISSKVADLSEWWSGQKYIKLLDANILACKDKIEVLPQLKESGAYVDFTQGLDARFITEDVAYLLKDIKKIGVHFAFDFLENENKIVDGLKLYAKICGLKKDYGSRTVYILTNYNTTIEQDLYRVKVVEDLGYAPYIMIYRKPSAPKEIKDLQRWCNNRVIYSSCSFEDYKKKGRKTQ